MQSQPPSAAIPTPQLSAPTTLLVHSLETAFLGGLFAGVLAGYQAVQSGLSPSYVIAAVALPIGGILAKWAQSSVLSSAIAKQNALIAVSDLAEHILPIHNVVDGLAQDMDRIFNHLSMQAHALPPAEVLAKVASLAAMVPALQQTLTAASTATTLAPAPMQASIPPVQPTQQPNFMLDQVATQSVPVAPQAQPSWPVVGGVQQTPFPQVVSVPTVVSQAPLSALPPSTVPMAALSWKAASEQPTQ